MVNKTISIPLDIFQKLGEEKNASQLITNLLRDYYKFKGLNEEDVLELRLKELENKKERILKEFDEEKEKFMKAKILKEQEELMKKEIEERKSKTEKEKIKQVIENIDYFYDLPENTDKLEIAENIIKNNINLFDYMKKEDYDKFWKND